MAMISRQVSTEAAVFGTRLLVRKRKMGLKRLESTNDNTRIDQNGYKIRPRKKIEIRKTIRKYLTPMGLGPPEG
jgi:hypothetical protein